MEPPAGEEGELEELLVEKEEEVVKLSVGGEEEVV